MSAMAFFFLSASSLSSFPAPNYNNVRLFLAGRGCLASRDEANRQARNCHLLARRPRVCERRRNPGWRKIDRIQCTRTLLTYLYFHTRTLHYLFQAQAPLQYPFNSAKQSAAAKARPVISKEAQRNTLYTTTSSRSA